MCKIINIEWDKIIFRDENLKEIWRMKTKFFWTMVKTVQEISKNSTCAYTQVWAIILKENRIISLWYNWVSSWIIECEEMNMIIQSVLLSNLKKILSKKKINSIEQIIKNLKDILLNKFTDEQNKEKIYTIFNLINEFKQKKEKKSEEIFLEILNHLSELDLIISQLLNKLTLTFSKNFEDKNKYILYLENFLTIFLNNSNNIEKKTKIISIIDKLWLKFNNNFNKLRSSIENEEKEILDYLNEITYYYNISHSDNSICWLEVHAEQNCITYAAKQWISTDWWIMFVTHKPCIHCARLIKQAWIHTIFFINDYEKPWYFETKGYFELNDINLIHVNKFLK